MDSKVGEALSASDWLASLFTPAHSSEWVSGLTGAGGAVLGSLVALAWTEWFNTRTRKRDDRDRLRTFAFGALQRLNQIYSDMTMTRDHLAEGFLAAHAQGAPFVSNIVRPLNRLSDPIHFSVDELVTLHRVGGTGLLNTVSALDRSYNVVMEAMATYAAGRKEVFVGLRVVASEGIAGVVELSEDELTQRVPQFEELDETLERCHGFASDIVDDAFTALTLLVTSKARPFGPRFRLSLKNAEGVEVSFGAPSTRLKRARLSLDRWIAKVRAR